MSIKLQGNNFNQRCVVYLPNDFCRTIVGCGGSGGYHAGNEPKVIVRCNKQQSNTSYISKQFGGEKDV